MSSSNTNQNHAQGNHQMSTDALQTLVNHTFANQQEDIDEAKVKEILANMDEEMMDEINARAQLEEYKAWKKNTPYLYDLVISHGLEWPSLTVQWLPDRMVPDDKTYSLQRLLLGTHTSSAEQNYLLIAQVKLPLPEIDIDAHEFANNTDDPILIGADSMNGKDGDNDANLSSGQYGSKSAKIEILQRICHDTEVNRVRYCPQNPDLIATRPAHSSVYIFDRTQHPSRPTPDAPSVSPDVRLVGHRAEGYGLAWNPHTEGHILTAGEDQLICYWDINAASKEKRTINPAHIYEGHTAIVNDVTWHSHHKNLFFSVDDHRSIFVWDTRSQSKSNFTKGHQAEINAVDCNPFSEYLFATGGNDNVVELWDLRNITSPLHSLRAHKSPVLSLQWSPFSVDVLASSSSDGRVYVWDISRTSDEDEMNTNEKADGPPELLFIHGGHTDKVGEFCWNGNEGEEWIIASVADDNVLQVWQMAENIYNDEDEDMDNGHDGNDDSGTEDDPRANSANGNELNNVK